MKYCATNLASSDANLFFRSLVVGLFLRVMGSDPIHKRFIESLQLSAKDVLRARCSEILL